MPKRLKVFYVERTRMIPQVRIFKVKGCADAGDALARVPLEAGDQVGIVRPGSDVVRMATAANDVIVLP